MYFLHGAVACAGNICRYIDRGNNISYEIFLCHYPIVQLAHHYGLIDRYGTATTFALVVAATLMAAVITYITVGRTFKIYQSRRRSDISLQQRIP